MLPVSPNFLHGCYRRAVVLMGLKQVNKCFPVVDAFDIYKPIRCKKLAESN